MKRFIRTFVLSASLLAINSLFTAHAQYSQTGTTAGGGVVITGSGAISGTLSIGSTPSLSAGGSDVVHLLPGTVVFTPGGADEIVFNTSNDTFTSSGTLLSDVGFTPLVFSSTSTAIANEAVTNKGVIFVENYGNLTSNFGNNYPAGQVGGYSGNGIVFLSGSDVNTITISNSGVISAASAFSVAGGVQLSTNFSGSDTGGVAANGITATARGSVSGFALSNSGTITAGSIDSVTSFASIGANYNGANVGGNIGNGVVLTSGDAVGTVTFTNNGVLAGGSITNVSNGQIASNYGQGETGANAGDAFAIASGSGITGVAITNHGIMAGGEISGTSSQANIGVNFGSSNTLNNVGGSAGDAIVLSSVGTIGQTSITNTGTIAAGSISYTNDAEIGASFGNYGVGGVAGTAIAVVSGSSLDTFSLSNSGAVLGGSLGNITPNDQVANSVNAQNIGLSAGDGVALVSGTTMNGVSISNSGKISGGAIGDVGSGGEAQIANNFASSGTSVGATAGNAIVVTSGSAITTFTLVNSGTVISGGMGTVSSQSHVGNNYNSSQNVGGNADNAVAVASGASLTGVGITNSGAITAQGIGNITNGSQVGSNFTDTVGGHADVAIALDARNGISGVTIGNSGTISAGAVGDLMSSSNLFGGNYSNSGPGAVGGSGAVAIAIASGSGGIDNASISNSGRVSGGSIASLQDGAEVGSNYDNPTAGGVVTTAIAASTLGDVNGMSFNNGGTITAGSISGSVGTSGATVSVGSNYVGGAAGGVANTGVAITAAGQITSFNFVNSGSITGGAFGNMSQETEAGANFNDSPSTGGIAGVGAAFTSMGPVSNLSITNGGSITAGSVGNIAQSNVGSNFNGTSAGGNLAVGLAITSGSTISGLTLTSQGTIAGGNLGNIGGSSDTNVAANFNAGATGGNAASGLTIDASTSLSNVSLTNNGSIRAGNIGNITGVNTKVGGQYNTTQAAGGNAAVGVSIATAGTISNFSFANNGTITGGNAGTISGTTGQSALGPDLGTALVIYSGTTGSTGLSFTNFGTVTGGNTGTYAAGYGISSNAGGLTINNWGAITAGSGSVPAAINLQASSNNTINLNGHSSVNGLITAIGGANNVMNIDFTGMSPAAQAALKAQIEAQGNLNNFDGTFTVRGVTYTVDPVIIKFGMSSYQLQGLTPNQQAIGASLDSLTSNPAVGSPLFNFFNAIDTSGNVPGALDQLSPQVYAALGDIAISQANFTVQSIDARLNNIRNGSESVDTTGIGGSTSGITSGLSKNDGKSSKEIQPAATPTPDRWGFFATGDGLFFRGNRNDVGLQDAKANSAGTLVGVDGKVGENGVVGALFAYNSTSAEMNGSAGHADIESYSGGLYGSWHEGGYYVNGLAAYTRNNYDLDRNIVLPAFFGDAKSSPDGDQVTANIDGGYDWNATDRLAVGPMAGVQYVHLNIDGFTESGAGAANLNVNSQDISSLQTRLGLHANYHLASSQTSSFALDFHAAWQHEYLNDSRSLGAGFAGIPTVPFGVQTAAPQRDAGIVGLGVNFTFKNRLTLFTEYELEMWSSSYFSQSVNGGARISF